MVTVTGSLCGTAVPIALVILRKHAVCYNNPASVCSDCVGVLIRRAGSGVKITQHRIISSASFQFGDFGVWIGNILKYDCIRRADLFASSLDGPSTRMSSKHPLHVFVKSWQIQSAEHRRCIFHHTTHPNSDIGFFIFSISTSTLLRALVKFPNLSLFQSKKLKRRTL